MGDPLKKVRPGQALHIPATGYNAFVDAARAHKAQSQGGRGQAPPPRGSGIVPVKNSSGGDRDRFDVLGISDLVYDPTENLEEFKSNPAIDGVTPATTSHVGKFVILLEPIPDGRIGRGLLVGVTPVKVNFAAADDTHADVADGQEGYLASGTSGAATILWKEDGTGEKWALVKLGAGTSGFDEGGGGDDVKVAVDAGATAGFLGPLCSNGVLRTDDGILLADGGDWVTLTVDDAYILTLVECCAGVDRRVAVDAGATRGYLGPLCSDGVLRTGDGLRYDDGGDYVQLSACGIVATATGEMPCWLSEVLVGDETWITIDEGGGTMTVRHIGPGSQCYYVGYSEGCEYSIIFLELDELGHVRVMVLGDEYGAQDCSGPCA